MKIAAIRMESLVNMKRLWGPIIFCALVLSCVPCRAQIYGVANDTATPIAGAGHNYDHVLSEIVNPANGSVSLRIQVTVPKNRGMDLPFSFDYDTAGVHHLTMAAGQGNWITGSGYLSVGGWSYGIPYMTAVNLNWPSQQTGTQGTVNCNGQNDFVFNDSTGERFPLALVWFRNPVPSCPGNTATSFGGKYQAQIVDPGSGLFKVTDADGTIFNFDQTAAYGATSGVSTSLTTLPTSIEDRNGNLITVTNPGSGAFTFTDSLGRSLVSSSGFGTAGHTYNLSVSGLAPYRVTWGTASSNFSVGSSTGVGNDCRGINSENGSQPVVTSITLPNGESYTFTYDSTYGLLSKITYPNGGYSRYVWGLNTQSDQIAWEDSLQQNVCQYNYDTPAVKNHYVSYDGTNEVLEEDYSYGTTWGTGSNTNWTSKTSAVTTTVRKVQSNTLQTLGSFTTNYSYTPYVVPRNQYDGLVAGAALQIPLEQNNYISRFRGKNVPDSQQNLAESIRDDHREHHPR